LFDVLNQNYKSFELKFDRNLVNGYPKLQKLVFSYSTRGVLKVLE